MAAPFPVTVGGAAVGLPRGRRRSSRLATFKARYSPWARGVLPPVGSTWSFLNGVSGIERDLFFLNNDTGWVISADNNPNGIIKTTNGGIDFFVQLDPNPFGSGPNNIFILNEGANHVLENNFNATLDSVSKALPVMIKHKDKINIYNNILLCHTLKILTQ